MSQLGENKMLQEIGEIAVNEQALEEFPEEVVTPGAEIVSEDNVAEEEETSADSEEIVALEAIGVESDVYEELEPATDDIPVIPATREMKMLARVNSLDKILRMGRCLCDEVIRKEKECSIAQIYVMPDGSNVIVDATDASVILRDAEEALQGVWYSYNQATAKTSRKNSAEKVHADSPEKNPFIQKDIRTICELLEECLQGAVFSERPNTRAKVILEEAILIGQAEPGNGFRNVEELRKELLRAEILVVIGEEILRYQDKLMVYAFEYAADQYRFIKYKKSVEGIVYLMEEPGEKSRHAVLFSKDEIIFLELHSGPAMYITGRTKIQYTDLLGAYCTTDRKGNRILQVLSGGDDIKKWTLANLELGNIGDGVVCYVIDLIVACIQKLPIAKLPYYYENLCERAMEIAPEEEKMGLIDWWDIVLMLGEKAHSEDESLCFDILMTTYQKKKSRAKIDKNDADLNLYRRRILQLVDAEGQVEARRVDIAKDRQITIPKTYFDSIGFAKEAEVIMKNGQLILRPIIEEDPEVKAERLLESLIAKGLTGDDLLAGFKAGQILEAEDKTDEDNEKKKSDSKSDDQKKKKEEKKKDSPEDKRKEKEEAAAEREKEKREKKEARRQANNERNQSKAQKRVNKRMNRKNKE